MKAYTKASKPQRETKFEKCVMTENQKDFIFKEYDKLNNEVAKLLEETRTREKYSIQ